MLRPPFLTCFCMVSRTVISWEKFWEVRYKTTPCCQRHVLRMKKTGVLLSVVKQRRRECLCNLVYVAWYVAFVKLVALEKQ